jgi:hypothetical protein
MAQQLCKVIEQNSLHPRIIKAMIPLGKRLTTFNYVIEQLHEDAFVYGYRAHTGKEVWTETGKQNAHKFLVCLREFYDLLNKFDWKKKPQIINKDAWAFYNKMKYSILSKNSDILTDLFEISTFYKYYSKKEAPGSYEVMDFFFVWQKLEDIFFYFAKYFKEEKEANEVQQLLEGLAKN